jgi:CPA1 family monovalent cation:H+ antiporter
VLVWGGLRGSLSMVLILGLPVEFPGRDLLLHLVFGVVGASLFVQGLTVAPLLARLGMSRTRAEAQQAYETERARLVAIRRASEHLDELRREGLVAQPVFERLDRWYEQRREQATRRLAEGALEAGELAAQEVLDTTRRLLDVEREAIRDAGKAEVVGAEAVKRALDELDERAERLKHAGDRPTGEVVGEVLDDSESTRRTPAP